MEEHQALVKLKDTQVQKRVDRLLEKEERVLWHNEGKKEWLAIVSSKELSRMQKGSSAIVLLLFGLLLWFISQDYSLGFIYTILFLSGIIIFMVLLGACRNLRFLKND